MIRDQWLACMCVCVCVYLVRVGLLEDYLLATGLSLICMVLSSWLFVLGRLKLLFFRWRREQHELRPWGEEESEDPQDPDLFITEISMQLA